MAYGNKNIDLRAALLVVFVRFLIGKGGIGLRLIWLTNWDYLVRETNEYFLFQRRRANVWESNISDHQLSLYQRLCNCNCICLIFEPKNVIKRSLNTFTHSSFYA